MPQAVALLSSGLDSAAALALAKAQGWQIRLALTFDYGQRAASRELAQAAALASHFGVTHQSMELPWFRGFHQGGGLLDASRPLPCPSVEDLSNRDFSRASAASVWVPNRNGVFIEIAAAFAEDRGCDAVLIGFNREEATTFADNSEAYGEAITRALAFSTRTGVKVVSPTAALDKSEIVRQLKALAFPFNLVWSCYQNQARMCGRCESCQRLKRAFTQNGIAIHDYFAD